MIIVYTLGSASPNIRKISIMLEEIGLAFTVRRVEKLSNGKYPQDFIAINPNTTVPTIVDQDTGNIIFESGAILHYLAEKAHKLLPENLIARGEVIKWLMFEVANVGPVMGELFHYMLMDTDEISAAHLQRYKDKVARHCAILEQRLDGREYLCNEYSIADIALYPWTVILEDMADIHLQDYPRLQKWANLISNRPAVLRSAQFDTAFSA